MAAQDDCFHLMSWNLLAHEFTTFEAKNHLNKSDSSRSPKESIDQLIQRNERARQTILSRSPSVVLLQEVSHSFLNDTLHGGLCPPARSLDSLYQRYHVVPAFGDSGKGANEPGTAVLVRKDCMKDAAVVDSFVVPGSRATTGGTSKSACAACVQLRDTRLWCVSIHTTWGGTDDAARMRLQHLHLLHRALAPHLLPGDSVVIGGDFNCSDRDVQLGGLESSDCLAQLKRVTLPAHTFTNDDGTTPC
jgi:endonuclease/exonuclease/phosphatase family metal-dependent hydrolase